MRVLHIGKFYPPFAGGMEYFLADLLGALQQQQISTAAVVHNHQKTLFGRVQKAVNGDILLYQAPCYGRLLYAPLSPSFPYWLGRAIREFQPDLLHLHLPNTSAFAALLLPSARRIPWLIHWHSDVVASHIDRRLGLAYRFYRPLEQRLLAHSRAIITTSPAYRDSSLALQNWQDRCHIIPLGLNPKRLATATQSEYQAAEQLWGKNRLRILTIGRLTYYKGHETLIQAVAELSNTKLIIAGQGERLITLQALIKSLHLTEQVSLSGWQSESMLSALLSSCDIVCLPSLERTEAFGMVLLEAMHFAKTVVVSDIPGSGVGWVVTQAQHGVTVPPANARQLAMALADLQHQPERRQQLGLAGQQALQQQFHINSIARQTTALYRQMLLPLPESQDKK